MTHNSIKKLIVKKRFIVFMAFIIISMLLIFASVVYSSVKTSANLTGDEIDINSVYTTGTSMPTTKESKAKKRDVDKSLWNLILINSSNKLPEDFVVDKHIIKGGHSIDKRAYADLQEMMDDSRNLGLSLLICSSFRNSKKQKTLYDKKVREYVYMGHSYESARQEAAKWIAVPGTSEHETGLALDIVSSSYQMLDEKQAQTQEQRWLMENSYKYGFILRYPTDKSHITGVEYEPWHYRYVGREAALEIYREQLCLEEYLNS